MSDQNSTTTEPTKSFSQEMFEDSVRQTSEIAYQIVNAVDEPQSKITEIAKVVIADYLDFTFSRESNGVPFKQRITRASELTTQYYKDLGDRSPSQVMEFGLLRGHDALFGASRVLHERSTIEHEAEKINAIIRNRVRRYAELQKALHAKKSQARREARKQRSKRSTGR